MSTVSLGLEYKIGRVRRGLDLYQVARELGITPVRLSQLEGGHRGLRAEIEAKLRALLGLGQGEGEGDGHQP